MCGRCKTWSGEPTAPTHHTTLSQVPRSAIWLPQSPSCIGDRNIVARGGVGRLLLHYLECTEKIYTSNYYQGADPIGVCREKQVGSESNRQPKPSLMNSKEGLGTCLIRLKWCLTFPKINGPRAAGPWPINAAKHNSLMVDRVCKPQLFFTCQVICKAT
jgi:hypothetical protein